MDLPLYTTVSRTELSDLGSIDYHLFDRAVVLDRVMRQAGQDAGQERFRNLLLMLRNAELTVEDWKYLMTQTTGEVGDTMSFDEALRLYPTIEAVAEHNVAKLRASGQPIAVLRAVQKGYIGRCRWIGACYLHCTRCSGDALCQLVGGSGFGQRCSRNC